MRERENVTIVAMSAKKRLSFFSSFPDEMVASPCVPKIDFAIEPYLHVYSINTTKVSPKVIINLLSIAHLVRLVKFAHPGRVLISALMVYAQLVRLVKFAHPGRVLISTLWLHYVHVFIGVKVWLGSWLWLLPRKAKSSTKGFKSHKCFIQKQLFS